ncbi:MAG: ribokinase, partial [Herpetosiphonaceae bacterium]|nr:ribokinase [Herpetosiphonaceae bacterium]
FGGALRDGLRDNRVDITDVVIDEGQPSGVALITVETRGENTIIVVPGANGAVGDADLQRLQAALNDARLLLLQLEVPLPAVVSAARAAHERGVLVMLDPAPAQPLPAELYSLVDILTPNATEAEMLVGFPIKGEAAARGAGKALLERGVRTAVIKLGEKGVYWSEANGLDEFMGAFPVQVVDTVAAGDAFNGGLATALSENAPFAEAIQWGLAAGGLAVTKQGAQPSLPNRQALLTLLGQHT